MYSVLKPTARGPARLKRKLSGNEGGENAMPPTCPFIKDRKFFDNTYDFLKQFAFNNKKYCVPDRTRMFDCNCGTNDSYCVDCGEVMKCEECEECEECDDSYK